MTNFFQILKLAEQHQLPRVVDGATGIDLHAFKLLRDRQLITAIDASADGDCYLDVKFRAIMSPVAAGRSLERVS